MTFSTYNFSILFLPIVMVGFYGLLKNNKVKACYCWLVIMSFIFYVCDSPIYFLLLLFNILVNYYLHKIICDNSSKIILFLGISFNVLLLVYFKYLNFGIDVCNLLFDTNLRTKEILLPLGISFITFQQIGFLVECYKGKVKNNCSLVEYMLFVSFFPHISSGPIIMYDEFIPMLKEEKVINWEKLASGIYMFFMGLGKKVLIADSLARGVNYGYANLNDINTTTGIFISVLYTLQIYYDFSGYSDMAIGIARMLQLDLPMNFNSPYKATTIDEFWERWHITLTGFLMKYVYIPLGGSRKGKLRTYINIVIVFLLSGLWHGASYTFILWGFVHGVFKVLTRHFRVLINKIPNWINHIMTLVFINFTWVLFRVGSLQKLKEYILMLMRNDWNSVDKTVIESILPSFIKRLCSENLEKIPVAIVLVVVLIAVTLWGVNTQEILNKKKYTVKSLVWMILIAILSVFSMSGVSTFIYAYF